MQVVAHVPTAGPVRLELYDVGGRLVSERTTAFTAGSHVTNLGGEELTAGVYLVRLTHGGQALTSRATVVR